MAKRKIDWDENKLNKWLQEGRGQGEGKEYKPWLTVTDFSSRGRCSRIKGIKTGRVHHFMADIETWYFYLLEFDEGNKIIDIREFYPLLDFDEVVQDKQDISKNLFIDKKTGCPYVLTTTFLITVKLKNGKTSYAARSVKSSKILERKTTLEKLEMERRYWQIKGVDWAIVTEKDINRDKAKNIEWALSSIHMLPDMRFNEDDIVELGSALQFRLANSTKSIRSVIADFDYDYALDTGTGLFLFRYLVAVKAIKIDMETPIDLNVPANSIQVVKDMEEGIISVNG
ncbi:TnsA endonuclease C-terminal domain-containing protein [Xylanivirga thermophila]|jgi:hypothetical protein|uniref:TnsA endonuclease C-terminal domain-containing protein n=1 Tax=Xylanivirga thermophila TaxID=2496273 RepID=UPI00101BDAA9|nr:TnsA endonuclease C-terminal domain-containing protein [Xylanivirga thermophila]